MLSSTPPHYVGILSNPLSGRNKKHSSSITRLLKHYPHISQYETPTAKDIQNAVSELAQKHIEVLVINGGDGTVQAVLTTLLHDRPFDTLPLLAILPSGTSNMNAGDVGLKGNRAKALEKLLSWAQGDGSQPKVIQRHILRVQRIPNENPIYGMCFGAGAIYQGAQVGWKTKESVGRLGEIGASLIMAKYFLSILSSQKNQIKPIQVGIRADNQSSPDSEYLTILVTTLERLFLGLRPYWGTEAGPLHYTAVKTKPHKLMRTLPSLLFGNPHPLGTPEHGYFSQNLENIELSLQDGFTVDGEDYQPDLKVGPVSISDGGQVSFIRF